MRQRTHSSFEKSERQIAAVTFERVIASSLERVWEVIYLLQFNGVFTRKRGKKNSHKDNL